MALSAPVNMAVMRMALAGQLSRQARDAFTALGRPWEARDQAYVEVLSDIHRGRFTEATALIDDLEPRAERIGHQNIQWAFRSQRALLRHLTGDVAGAEGDATKALEFARAHHLPWGYLTDVRRSEVLFLQGHVDAALEVARRLASAERPSRYKQHSRGVLFRFLSYVAPDAARAYRRDWEVPMPVVGAVNAYGHWSNLVNVVEGLYVLGDHSAVAELRPVTETLAATDITVMTLGTLPRAAAGLTAACAGAWDVAETHVQEALVTCDSLPIPVSQGTTREWYADMLMERHAGGDRAHAAALYAEAAEIYDTIGMALHASRLAERRARLNLR